MVVLSALHDDVLSALRIYLAPDETVAYDYWAPCMDLVRLLDLDLSEIPSAAYLSADPALVSQWREKLSPISGLRIGINSFFLTGLF